MQPEARGPLNGYAGDWQQRNVSLMSHTGHTVNFQQQAHPNDHWIVIKYSGIIVGDDKLV